MATVALQYVGSAVGGMLGGPLGAALGRAAGGVLGSLADAHLFGTGRAAKGPRLDDLAVMGSSEGASIPAVWGRSRIAGQVIWATDFEEEATRSGSTGAKGIDAGADAATTYSYFANFAVGLCEGPIASIGRVWADGREISLDTLTWRLYRGDEEQMADSLILARQGEGAPAYRGLAYVVFERMPLAGYGNRLPQLSFEVTRRTAALETMIRAVDIIPGATEFGYDTEVVTRRVGRSTTQSENVHTGVGVADWTVSLDQLQDVAPALEAAALTVAWFGDDLRCGHCAIRPGVEAQVKSTRPYAWSVAGLERDGAHLISAGAAGANFGGTPSDAAVMRAIRDLKARGLAVMFYPFILMDIPPGNVLPDVDTGAAGQPSFPWRGRISAPPGSDVAAGVAAFFGTAGSSGMRRMVLHYARLCADAGGVDAFLLGSELRGLTRLRDAAGCYPAADALAALAVEVRAILPHARISYAADWSEYGAHVPDDGSGDVRFPLDPFWASPAVDFVAIDNYLPLSDWRDGEAHLDRLAGHRSPYALSYLGANVEGGEWYDWHYPTAADREAQVRTPIADWVYRAKDLRGWWSGVHRERIAGAVIPTPWVPEGKPIWFAEAGCPAIDKGANAPNFFVDPKSAESATPYGSSGARDDFMQRRHLEALLAYWSGPSRNPVSGVYGGPMIDVSRIFLWAWDARPYPAFPALTSVWSDGANHETGHWLNGRLGAAPLAELVAAILQRYGFAAFDTDGLEGVIDGYVIDGVISARDAIEPLSRAFAFDAVEQGGVLRFVHRNEFAGIIVTPDALVEQAAGKPLYALRRSQASDLPTAVKLAYRETARDYRTAVVEARRQNAPGRLDTLVDLPAVLPQAIAQRAADGLLHEAWASRETASFALPPSFLRFEPGDPLTLLHHGRAMSLRIDEIAAAGALAVAASECPDLGRPSSLAAGRVAGVASLPVFGAPRVVVMELPWTMSADAPLGLWIAADADPWGGGLAVYRKMGSEFVLAGAIGKPAVMGETLDPLAAGPLWRRDARNVLTVSIDRGGLRSVDADGLLSGANLAAIGDEATGFEVIQFEKAELTAPSTYSLSRLLRGQHGSAPEMLAARPAGAAFVLLDGSLLNLPLRTADAGLAITWRIGPRHQGPGEATFVERTVTVAAKAARPLAPCHLQARRNPDGGIAISWMRQTRLGGDSWALADVPLDEPAESYALDILSDDVVRRTITVDRPCADYALEHELADFGVVQSAVRVRIAQLSPTYGRGASTERLLHV